MAIVISDNFSLNSKQFIDERVGKASTLLDLKNWDTSVYNIPDGFEVWVSSTREWYTFDSNNPISETTGRFRARSQAYKQNFANSRDEIITRKFWGFTNDSTTEEISNVLVKGKSVTVIDPEYGTNIYVLANPSAPFDINSWNPISFDDGDSLKIYTRKGYESLAQKPSQWIEVPDNGVNREVTDKTIRTTNDGSALNVLFSALRALQSEVARLRNSFKYGICSYSGTTTALSAEMGAETDPEEEPLWAVDEDGLSLITDATLTISEEVQLFPNTDGNVMYDSDSKTVLIGNIGASLNYDGNLTTIQENDFFNATNAIEDSKLFMFLTTTNPKVKIVLIEKVGATNTFDEVKKNPIILDIEDILGSKAWVKQYNIMACISRKDTDGNGFNFIYLSITNAVTNYTLAEGYYYNGNLVKNITQLEKCYTFNNVIFNENSEVKMNLKKLNCYSKYQDFSQNVIPSQPSDENYRYKVAHLTIRAVEKYSQLEEIKDQILCNELIYDESAKALWIKDNNNNLVPIGKNTTEDTGMTVTEMIDKLKEMGIVYGDNENLQISNVSDITFINEDIGKSFKLSINGEGDVNIDELPEKTLDEIINGVKNDQGVIIEKGINQNTDSNGGITINEQSEKAIRGFIARLHMATDNIKNKTNISIGDTSNFGLNSDRVKIGAFYAPLEGQALYGCSHAFVELENTSNKDVQLDGCYLHFKHQVYSGTEHTTKIEHLALKGKIPAGGTYLIRGVEYPNKNRFINVNSFDQEWYVNKQLIDFTFQTNTDEGGFALTYGQPELSANDILIEGSTCVYYYIDAVGIAESTINWTNSTTGKTGGKISLKANCIVKNTFELDPAKQAFQSLTTNDSSRVRNATAADTQYLNLDKEYITFPHSPKIKRPVAYFTPKASFEHKNVCTDKTKMDTERPNAVTCAFGINASNTRCFNWVSSGLHDEYIWIRKEGSNDAWVRFESYTNIKGDGSISGAWQRIEWDVDVLNSVYARRTGVFPADGTFYTSHKVIVKVPTSSTQVTEYEYVVGRSNQDGTPDLEHTSNKKYFRIYPNTNTYIPRIYQTTDQQGFHWIEYQAWSAAAIIINNKINADIFTKVSSPNISNIATYWEINDKGEYHYTKDTTIVSGKNYYTHNPIIPILVNTGDMTQNGTRINEWLDYFIGAEPLIDHLEHMCVVGNNDLCGTNYEELGTGDDYGKSNSYYFHIFYCYEMFNLEVTKQSAETLPEFEPNKTKDGKITNIRPIVNGKYIPSFYHFYFPNFAFIMVNSEITWENCRSWFKTLKDGSTVYNIYTGFSVRAHGVTDNSQTYINSTDNGNFTTIYTMLSAILNNSRVKNKKIIAMCHEMPFTVITKACLTESEQSKFRSISNSKDALVGSHLNQISSEDDRKGIYWFSRLMESYGIKLVLGGHKHTFAATWPVSENYVSSTLDAPKSKYVTLMSDDVTWSDGSRNLTKVPKCFCPNGLTNTSGYITPLTRDISNGTNGKVVYFMCQATGFKLKSNKELPGNGQLFSRVLPQTQESGTPAPSQEQLYPMFAIVDLSTSNMANIALVRVVNIMNGASGTFNQQVHSTSEMKLQYATNNYTKLIKDTDISALMRNNETPFIETSMWTENESKLMTVSI